MTAKQDTRYFYPFCPKCPFIVPAAPFGFLMLGTHGTVGTENLEEG